MNKFRKTKKKKNNGITLIALIITIIILLILTGVTIATLTGEDGILEKATNASEKTKKANAEEQVKLAITASIKQDGKSDLEELNTELEKIEGLTYNNVPISDRNTIELLPATVNVDGYDIIIDIDFEEIIPLVPEGFYRVKGTTIKKGFVISDVEGDDVNNTKGGNQYVWIPVDGILGEDGKTIQNAVDGEIILGRYTFSRNGKINTNLVPTTLGGEIKIYNEFTVTETSIGKGNTTAKDINAFINSVRENGGYYIARFEASKNSNTNKAESKYNKTVWNNISQQNAAIACQNLYADVNSDLINSYAWDTATLFIQKYGKTDYSFEYGVSFGSSLQRTGLSRDVQLNIYDMAGNCFEWTTETGSDSNKAGVVRGGDYYNKNDYMNVRNWSNPSVTFNQGSFRPILYF